MSRTDNTRPFYIQAADLNNIPQRGIKLDQLADIVYEDERYRHCFSLGINNAGHRKYWQKVFTAQRRQRDRRACHKARFNPDVDFAPVAGDRRNVSWYMD